MRISAIEIKDAVDFLSKYKEGCYFRHFDTDDHKRRWGIAIGFSNGFDEQEPFGTFRICSKICYNDSYMKTDFDLDFTMPTYENGDDCDTCTELGSDYELEARRLSDEYNEVFSEFIYTDLDKIYNEMRQRFDVVCLEKEFNKFEFVSAISFSAYDHDFYVYRFGLEKTNGLNVSCRDEYGTNLFDYVCAARGCPLGAVTDHTVEGVLKKIMETLEYFSSLEEDEE